MLGDIVSGKKFRYELYLCKPYGNFNNNQPVHEKIGCLTKCAIITNIKKVIKNIDELEFYINLNWDDRDDNINEYFDLVNAGCYVLLESYSENTLIEEKYFYIYEAELSGGEKNFKTVKCYSKEYQWNKIKIRQFQETDEFRASRRIWTDSTFNPSTPTAGGIMDYIIQVKLLNTWDVTYVSPSIADKYRTFDISEQSLIEAVHYIESLYNCIFFFNTTNNTIQIKTYDELPTQTGLIITGKNYLKSIQEQIKVNDIVTRIYATGINDITLHYASITGQGYIDNFTFFRTPLYMSSSLRTALDNLDILIESKRGDFQALQASLLAKQDEKLILEYQLYDLQTFGLTISQNEDVCLRGSTPTSQTHFTVEGHNYDYWHQIWLQNQTDVSNKQKQINAKQLEINSVQNSMQILSNTLSYASNLNTTQLQELLQFINEETISCQTESPTELFNFAEDVLNLKSQPPLEFTIDMVDIFDNNEAQHVWDKLTLGSLVALEFDDLNIKITPRIVEYSHNPSSNTLNVTVSNKPYFEDDVNFISNLIAFSRSTSTTINYERPSYLEYVNAKANIITTSTTISTTNQDIQVGDGSVITNRGYYLRDVLNANGQMRILGDRILFTKTNWDIEDNISTAITSEGIYCTKFFTVTNTDGSVKIDSNTILITNMSLNLQTTNGKNRIIIDPTNGIKVQKNDADVFYVNSSGDLYLKNAYFQNSDASISISPSMISVDNGKIEIKSGGRSTILDAYGIDTKFIKSFKNMIYNSSFEVFPPSGVPYFWTVSGTSAVIKGTSFFGSYSLNLKAGESVLTSGYTINPQWYNDVSTSTRVAFYKKGGSVKVEVLNGVNYVTIYNAETPSGATHLDYVYTTNWNANRCNLYFPHGAITSLQLKITNTDTVSAYIDAVSLEPDVTGKWASFYTDGVNSVSANFGETGQALDLYINDVAPPAPVHGTMWIDTNQEVSNLLMGDAEKSKLAGIADSATKTEGTSTNGYIKINGTETKVYEHPSSHSADMITQTPSYRFVTDSEKSTWNAKASTAVATQSTNGLMSSTDKTKLDGLSNNPTSSTPVWGAIVGNINNQTDLMSILNNKASTPVATTSVNGLMSSTDKTRLDYLYNNQASSTPTNLILDGDSLEFTIDGLRFNMDSTIVKTSISATPTNNSLLTEKAVADAINNIVIPETSATPNNLTVNNFNINAIATSISATPVDTKLATEKAVSDAINNIVISEGTSSTPIAGNAIDITNNVIDVKYDDVSIGLNNSNKLFVKVDDITIEATSIDPYVLIYNMDYNWWWTGTPTEYQWINNTGSILQGDLLKVIWSNGAIAYGTANLYNAIPPFFELIPTLVIGTPILLEGFNGTAQIYRQEGVAVSSINVKAIDADIVPVSHIELDNFKSGVVNTVISATPTDNSILTEKAVSDLVSNISIASSISKYAVDIGDNSNTSFVVTHNLNSRDLCVTLRNNSSPYNMVFTDIEFTTINTCTVSFSTAPSTNQYRITLIG